MHPIVDKLLKKTYAPQKSEEWYRLRYGMITASDLAACLGCGKFNTCADIVAKKSQPFSMEDHVSVSNPFFEWGNLFEPIAISIYEKMKDAVVHEFGLINHPSVHYFGASPDGITSDGVMVEIKAPYKRKLNGEIPKQYYYQVQGQMDVCELTECDYFECVFQKYDTFDDLRMDYVNKNYCGTYSRQNVVDFSVFRGIEFMSIAPPDENLVFWQLKDYVLQSVVRDAEFITDALKRLETVWCQILKNRENSNYMKQRSISIETEPLHPACMFRDID